MTFRLSLTCSFSFFVFSLFAQTANLSGIINHYAAVEAIDTCNGRLTVSDTTGFRPGSPVLLIQMQGAQIFETDNFLYGTITAMRAAGRYEQALIDSVAPGAVYLQNRPLYPYNLADKVQLVTLLQHADAVVTDTLRALPWNGSIGGVIAVEISGTLTLNAPVSADGTGFRGGNAVPVTDNNCNFLVPQLSYFFAPGDWRGATKGEGIAVVDADKVLGRGPQANGGGGGNDHNSGGGGGGNITDGGDGGDNDEPGFFNCDGNWPGLGGINIPSIQSRLFLGGGGGAGHGNGTSTGDGGNGGGIIYLKAQAINGLNPLVSSRGTVGGAALGDGAGGGGAGGTIWLDCLSTPTNLQINTQGGSGGNTDNFNQNRCFGPGGGGSGGRINTNVPGAIPSPGGLPGVIFNSTNGCNGSNSGAQPGEAGIVFALPVMPQSNTGFDVPEILSSPQSQSVCEGEDVVFAVQTNAGNWNYQWQVNDGSGWVNIANSPSYTATDDTLLVVNTSIDLDGLMFRCFVERPGCYAVTSGAAMLNVEPAPNAIFNAFLSGTVLDVINFSTNATTYFWDFGDGSSSTQVMPQHTYGSEGTFILTLYAINNCDTTIAVQTVNTLLLPVASFTILQDIEPCGNAQVSFVNESVGSSLAFNWLFPGGSPSASTAANPMVTYSNSGNYIATLIASNPGGDDTISLQVVVSIINPPTAAFIYNDLTGGVFQFNNLSTSAADWLWDFGDGTTSASFDPSHTYLVEGNYVVTLWVWNACDTSQVQQDVAYFAPPQAGIMVADTVYACQEAIVFFNNASTGAGNQYQWLFPGGDPAFSTQTNPFVTYPASGNYQAILVATNAVGADTAVQDFNVQVLGFPAAGFTASAPLIGLVQFQNQSLGATTYTWDFGDGSASVNTFNASHQYTQNGVYVITLVAANPCGASVLQQTIEVMGVGVGVSNMVWQENLKVFPNPNHGFVHVDASETGENLLWWRLHAANGILVMEQQATVLAPKFLIPFEDLPAGLYFLEIQFEKGRVVRRLLRL